MQRVAVIAKLKADSLERARELIEKGPPFDPEEFGFERHSVYLSDEFAVFVFEGDRVNALVRTIGASGTAAAALADWEPMLDGLPRLAADAYTWERDPDPSCAGAQGD